MRKSLLFLSGICLLLFFTVPALNAQKLEAQGTQELSKDARKGELVSFEYDQDAKEYWLTFKREKGKKKIFEIYQFDYDFKLINNETLEEKTKRKDRNEKPADVEPWHNPKVVRLGNFAGENAMQIVLRLGTLKREWVTRHYTYGNYDYTLSSYEFEFEEEKKVKPKIDPKIEYPPGTPKGIQKMVTNMASKIRPLEFMTDEPAMEIQTGNNKNVGLFDAVGMELRTRDYSEATGDIVVAGMQEYPLSDKWIGRVVLLKYSSKDLSLLSEEIIPLEYPMFKAFSKVLEDETIALVLMPYKPQKGDPDPNPQRFFYMKVDKDAKVVEKTYFESPCRQWAITDAVLDNDGGLYFYGLASTKNNGKYRLTDGSPLSKSEGIQVIKFKGGKTEYVANVTVEELQAKLTKPANQKKADAFEGKKMALEAGNHVLSPEGELLISGRMEDNSSVNFFHFAADGKFKAQYCVQPEQKIKEGVIDYTIFLNSDKKTATVFFGELEGVDNGRTLKYPRMGTIDVSAGKISDMKRFGYSKKEKYYMDDVYPFVFIDKEHVTFFSRDAKDRMVWMGRVALPN